MDKDQIKNVKLSFTCAENWDAMLHTVNGRYCDKCNKTVYDFTNSKVDEFRAILAENNYNVCGRFRADQTAYAIMLPFWKKWISAAMLLIGINLFGCKGSDSNQTIVGDTVVLPPTSYTTPPELNQKASLNTNQIIKGDKD